MGGLFTCTLMRVCVGAAVLKKATQLWAVRGVYSSPSFHESTSSRLLSHLFLEMGFSLQLFHPRTLPSHHQKALSRNDYDEG